MYVNRSLVDPSLDYNRGGFDSDLFREQLYEDIYYN